MDDYAYHLYEEARARRLSRQDLLVRASVAGLSLPTVGSVLTAFGGEAQAATRKTAATPKRGGTLRIGLQDPGAGLDPPTMNTVAAYQTVQLAGEYLCFPDANFRLQPMLASSWKGSNGGRT